MLLSIHNRFTVICSEWVFFQTFKNMWIFFLWNLNVEFHFLLFSQVDRVSYLLQEIYGIENKNNQETKVGTANWEESRCCKKLAVFDL